MIYTLTQGVHGYNRRLHYSLYGGVEYFPNYSLAWKELLPLAAVPAVAVALVFVIINFHVPAISTPAKGKIAGSHGSSNSALSSLVNKGGSSTTAANSSSVTGASTTPAISSNGSTVTTDNFLTPPVSTVGATTGGLPGSVVGGLGSGAGSTLPGSSGNSGGGGTTTPPTGSAPFVSADVTTPVLSADASASTQPPQAGVDVITPVTGTAVSAGLAL